MKLDPAIQDDMLAAIPSLRAFAYSLCGSADQADDLVQESLVRAIAKIHQFSPGTSLNAWLFTILRNHFLSNFRKKKREVEDVDGKHAKRLATKPEQIGRLEFKELRGALATLPEGQREVIILVGASGFTYEEAAEITGCAVGTVKSRVSRARARLAELLSFDETEISSAIGLEAGVGVS